MAKCVQHGSSTSSVSVSPSPADNHHYPSSPSKYKVLMITVLLARSQLAEQGTIKIPIWYTLRPTINPLIVLLSFIGATGYDSLPSMVYSNGLSLARGTVTIKWVWLMIDMYLCYYF